jgi:hypothetical protein
MSVFQAVRTRIVRRAVAPIAAAFDGLASEIFANIPATTTFSRDDVVELLRDFAEQLRRAEP